MEEMLKDVLIKDAAGVDKVFIVDNLPKSLLYRKALKMIIDYTDPQNRQNLVPEFILHPESGLKQRTGQMIDELLPGIERDPNDDAYVFFTDYNNSVEALARIDRYISMTVPVSERVPERINYAAQPGNMNSAPLSRNRIPRVVLPELVSPPVLVAAQAVAPRALDEGHIPQAPTNRVVKTADEVAQEKRDRMAKARAAKAAKQTH